jgi:MFS family permease
MLSEAFAYPRRDDDWLRTVLIGGVLLLFSPLFLPALVVQGYLVRVLQGVVGGVEEPPVFEEWVEMLIDGVKLLVVQFVYGLVPTVLAMVGVFVAGVGVFVASEGGQPGGGVGAGVGLFAVLVFLLAFLFGLLAAYLTPAALANFAREDDLMAAFDVGTIREVVSSRAYFVAALYAIVASIVVAVASVLVAATIVGAILVPFVAFYGQVVTYHVLGRGFVRALGLDADGGSVATDAGTGPTG